MSIEHFTGTVWSESLLKSLSEKYVGVANCFRDFEGEIKEKGSVVRMCGLSDIGYKGYFTFEACSMLYPRGMARRECAKDTRLYAAPLSLRIAEEKLLYEIGKTILTAYDCFEE